MDKEKLQRRFEFKFSTCRTSEEFARAVDQILEEALQEDTEQRSRIYDNLYQAAMENAQEVVDRLYKQTQEGVRNDSDGN